MLGLIPRWPASHPHATSGCRGHLHDGLRRPLPGGGADPPCAGRRASPSTLSPVTNARLRRVRRGHRLRHRGRASARPGRLSRRAGGEPAARIDWCSPRRRGRSTCATSASGGRGRRARAGGDPKVRRARSTRSPRPSRGARRPRGRRGVRRLGRRRAAHRGRVGVRRPRRSRGRDVHLGRRATPRRPDHGEHLGRARLPVAQHRRERLARAPRRSAASRPTGSVCSTWPATCGSGPTTGGRASTPTTPTSRAACR